MDEIEPTELDFLPGIVTEGADRDLKGRWKSGSNVRFRKKLPEKIGGWSKAFATAFTGICRTMLAWSTLALAKYIALGTHSKLQLFDGSALYNITPLDASGNLTDPFSTTNTSAVVNVADVAHARGEGDTVIFSGASAVGGITVDGTYTVTSVVDSDNYTITHGSAATSTAGPGGGTVAYQYELSIGAINSSFGLGWGAGAWGASTWGTARSTSNFLRKARTWSLDLWGEDLIANPRGGKVYAWDASVGTGTRAAEIAAAPDTAKFIIVSPQDRHLIAFGAHDGSVDDPKLVRWCDQEDYTDWTPTSTNTAGDKRLDVGNEIVSALRSQQEILIWTDLAFYSMFFTGPPYTFGFREQAEQCGLVGPNARILDRTGVAYWMGCQDFFVYDGRVRLLPCDVRNYVMGDMNEQQRDKIVCGSNREFTELIWLYPSAASAEIDRWVAYELETQVWSLGSFARTAWIDRSVFAQKPIAAGADGYLYQHETGQAGDGAAIAWHLESYDAEIGQGGQMMHVGKLWPNFLEFAGSMTVYLKSRRYPQGAQKTKGPYTIGPATEYKAVRARGRQMAIRVEGSGLSDAFRMGKWRATIQPDGGR